MRRAVFTLFLSLIWAGPLWADGVTGALTDPPVVPIVRSPDPLGAPLVIGEQTNRSGVCHNSQNPGPSPVSAGYEVRLACDHILIGLALLGGLFALGSGSGTN
jgi:hypothetical protein